MQISQKNALLDLHKTAKTNRFQSKQPFALTQKTAPQ
jgi:hypothetical protein